MGVRNDPYRELSSSSRGRDALLRVVSREKLSRLLDHLERQPLDWALVEIHAGAVLEALSERSDLGPDSPDVRALLRNIHPERLYAKANEMEQRGQLNWALLVVTEVLDRHPQVDSQWWWLLAQVQAGLKQRDQEYTALVGVLERDPEPTLQIKVAERFLRIDAWQDGFVVLRRLYAMPDWRDRVVGLLATVFLSDEDRSEADCTALWDQYWHPILDYGARVKLWSQLLKTASEQITYDRDALADGIDAMQACLDGIGGRNLELDINQAQLGHQLALKLMRFVRSLEPLERTEQSVYMMLLDMLVAWETSWRERGITLEHSMEKDLGSVWVDEQVFALALEILWEQFAAQIDPPARVALQVCGDMNRQSVIIALESTSASGAVRIEPLATIDSAFVERVMRGHSCQWRYDREESCSLTISIPTAPAEAREKMCEELSQPWLVSWQIRGLDGLSTQEQQECMIREPFRFGLSLIMGLKRRLIADWAEQIRVIVHDLKNLFTFAQQWISQALADPYSWNMAMERLTEIKGRMQQTLTEIRELAVLSGPPACAQVAIVELVRRVVSNSRAFLEAHAVTCAILQRTGRGDVWADPERLISAITNLLKNGVEAMPEGGQLKIVIDQTSKGWVQLIIEDMGVGIEAEELPNLFAVGRSTKPGGSGVGLAAVARTLTSMGAEIAVASKPGMGSQFTITFAQTTVASANQTKPLPVPRDHQTRLTQQALRAAAAMHSNGDLRMTVHLWYKALIGQIEPALMRSLPPVRARRLLVPVTSTTKRGEQQLSDQSRQRLQDVLGGQSKQLAKKGETVVQTLMSGDWDRLTHPLHWAVLLQLFVGRDVYPWPTKTCDRIARWLADVDLVDDHTTPDSDRITDLGAELGELLELALPGHLGA